jgi:Alpha/beta hydrolase domain
VTDGTAPPASALPRIDNGTLVTLDKLKFPKLPTVNMPVVPMKAYRADYGPDFIRKGIVTQEPPAIKSAFAILVPQVDADGNEVAGIRLPELAVPIATYTGWNMFNEKSGPTNVLSSMQGSFIPLARSKADRDANIDPRRSIEERYRGRDQYLAEITKAANDLVTKGYLLKNDVPRIVAQAGTRWDFATRVVTSTP